MCETTGQHVYCYCRRSDRLHGILPVQWTGSMRAGDNGVCACVRALSRLSDGDATCDRQDKAREGGKRRDLIIGRCTDGCMRFERV